LETLQKGVNLLKLKRYSSLKLSS